MNATAQRLTPRHTYTLGEEITNGVIHGVGVVLSVAALVLLVILTADSSAWVVFAAVAYGTTLLLEFTASTLYHSLPQPRAKHIFKILDHAGIYLLIAGTYTPFLAVTLHDSGGGWMLALVWGLAVAGVAAEAFWVYRPKWVSVIAYLGMGWLAVFAIGPLRSALGSGGLWLLVAGGLAYTAGTVSYLLKGVPYTHAVWHVFVLGGSVCHFLAVALYVV